LSISLKTNQKKTRPGFTLILLAFIAFIALGMPDGLLGVAWPTIRHDFNIPLDSLGWLLAMATTGYIISSFTSGQIMARLGVGRLLSISCLLTASALVGYTLVPQWWMMVLLGIAAGLGAGAIDAGLNTYVAAHFSERTMQWLHASYGIGVTTGPFIMTFALTTLNSWRAGYRIVGGFQLLLGLCFLLTIPLWSRFNSPSKEEGKRITEYKTPIIDTLKQPGVWLSMALFFLYVGAEISLGAWAYTLLTESRGVTTQVAGFLAGSYWGTFTIGRILAGLVLKKINSRTLVIFALSGALSGALLLWWNPANWANLAAVALIGFSIAPIFPALTSSTSQRVEDKHTANTIGMQMAASGLSGAIIPGLVGVLARRISLEVIPVCLAFLFTSLLALFLIATKKRNLLQKT